MTFLKSKVAALPEDVLRVVRSFGECRVCVNPVTYLEGVLRDHGAEVYRMACAETLAALRKRFGTPDGQFIHIRVGEGIVFSIHLPIRPGENSIQYFAGPVHPLREIA